MSTPGIGLSFFPSCFRSFRDVYEEFVVGRGPGPHTLSSFGILEIVSDGNYVQPSKVVLHRLKDKSSSPFEASSSVSKFKRRKIENTLSIVVQCWGWKRQHGMPHVCTFPSGIQNGTV